MLTSGFAAPAFTAIPTLEIINKVLLPLATSPLLARSSICSVPVMTREFGPIDGGTRRPLDEAELAAREASRRRVPAGEARASSPPGGALFSHEADASGGIPQTLFPKIRNPEVTRCAAFISRPAVPNDEVRARAVTRRCHGFRSGGTQPLPRASQQGWKVEFRVCPRRSTRESTDNQGENCPGEDGLPKGAACKNTHG